MPIDFQTPIKVYLVKAYLNADGKADLDLESADIPVSCCNQNENDARLYCDEKTNILPPPSFHNDGAMVGIDAMMRSNSTLEDFVIFYVSQNGSKPASISIQIPAYTFVYRKLYISADEDPVLGAKFVRIFQKDPFRPLLSLLQRQGLLNKRITQELRSGEEYWALERKLCCALESNKEICIEDVTRAIHLKSFDYRVLNLLLYQLRGEKNFFLAWYSSLEYFSLELF
ncbi:hypothetical protein OROGR_019066 [Orobanche gracilis]